MPKSVNDKRKEQLESADYHLHTAIDRLFGLWADVFKQHPELAAMLTDLMCNVEQSRFRIQQFYHLCWGGQPDWMIAESEITHRLRQQRAEWALEITPCKETVQSWQVERRKRARNT